MNQNEDEGYVPGGMVTADPDLRVVLISNEAGVWYTVSEYHIDVNCFYKKLDYSGNHQPYEEFEDRFGLFWFNEECCVFEVDNCMYFFFSDWRSLGGNAEEDIIHDYVVINLSNGDFHTIRYYRDIFDPRSNNGMLLQSNTYPAGVKDYILHRIEIDPSKTDDRLQSSDPDHAVKDWFLDNPHYNGKLDSLDYGKKHSLFVRMYDKMPNLDDYEQNIDMFKVYSIGHYQVYSRWRGDVFAHDTKTNEYFVVWADLLHFKTKIIEDAGDNWIRIVYVESINDVVVYNLDTHSYYFSHADNNSDYSWEWE